MLSRHPTRTIDKAGPFSSFLAGTCRLLQRQKTNKNGLGQLAALANLNVQFQALPAVMSRLLSFVLLATSLLQVTFSQSVDDFISTESPIAKTNLLANIGSDGSKSQGAKAGIVIASPSTTNPDYLYSWTRDSSLVFKALIDQFTQGLDTTLRNQIDDFITAESILQQVSNPSGTVSTGGLGEPKFNIDETAFTGAWGRPQRGMCLVL